MAKPTTKQQRARSAFYGIVGNGETCALVSPQADVDWLCAPRFDSPFIFGRMVDAKSGFLKTEPLDANPANWSQEYLPGTPVLRTTARDAAGHAMLTVTDFMPRARREFRRMLHGGRARVRLLPTFDYRRAGHSFARSDITLDGRGFARFDMHTPGQALRLFVPRDAVVAEKQFGNSGAPGIELEIHAAAGATLILVYSDMLEPHLPDPDTDRMLDRESHFWSTWLARSPYHGPHADAFTRSLITMKLLTYRPSGALLAAATTSIPQHPGSGSNWDYRLCWVRDGAYAAAAYAHAGYHREARAFLDLMFAVMAPPGQKPWQPLYRIDGDPDGSESILKHLSGFHDDGPVRIGNLAYSQLQNDLEGEVLEALWELYERTRDTELLKRYWDKISAVADYVAAHWQVKDNGIWELRGVIGHNTHSKILCWTALDRAARTARVLGHDARAAQWRAAARAVRSDLLRRGWNRAMHTFTLGYDAPIADSCLLCLPLCGMLGPHHPRVRAMVRRVHADLTYDHLVARNIFETAPFPLTTYWLARYHALAGERDTARAIIDSTIPLTTDLGLFNEHVLSAEDQPKPEPMAYVRSARDLALAHASPKGFANFVRLMGDYYKHRNTFKEKTETPKLTPQQLLMFRGNFPQLYSHEELVRALLSLQD